MNCHTVLSVPGHVRVTHPRQHSRDNQDLHGKTLTDTVRALYVFHLLQSRNRQVCPAVAAATWHAHSHLRNPSHDDYRDCLSSVFWGGLPQNAPPGKRL